MRDSNAGELSRVTVLACSYRIAQNFTCEAKRQEHTTCKVISFNLTLIRLCITKLYLTHSSTLKYETLPLNFCTTGLQIECLGFPVYLCGTSLLILKFSKD